MPADYEYTFIRETLRARLGWAVSLVENDGSPSSWVHRCKGKSRVLVEKDRSVSGERKNNIIAPSLLPVLQKR
jgi:hypothetical protein